MNASDRWVLQRLLLEGWNPRGRESEPGEGFTVAGIGKGLPLSDRSVREALRRLSRRGLVHVEWWARVPPMTRSGTAVSRKPRKIYRLTAAGYETALGRTDRPIPVAFDFRAELPVPATVLHDFLMDPTRTGVDEPVVRRLRTAPPEYLVSFRGIRVFYRVAERRGDEIAMELSLGFDTPGAEPLWGRAALRLQENPARGCVLRAERVEASANGVAVAGLIHVAANLATDLFLRDVLAALPNAKP